MRILLKFLTIFFYGILIHTSCSQKNPTIKQENIERLIEIEAKQNLIKTILQDSSIFVKNSTKERYNIYDFKGHLFLYLSDNNCLTCMESIVYQTRTQIENNKNIHLFIVYSSNSLGNYYSLKQRIKTENISIFYTDKVPNLLNELNEIFFFTISSDKIVENVYIPYENPIKLHEYLSNIAN